MVQCSATERVRLDEQVLQAAHKHLVFDYISFYAARGAGAQRLTDVL